MMSLLRGTNKLLSFDHLQSIRVGSVEALYSQKMAFQMQ